VALGLVYDLLRALRLRRERRGLTTLLDALYCALLALSAIVFALRVGDGELRLYMLLAALAGAFVYARLCAPLLRPVWTFWAETLYELVHLLCMPLQETEKIYGKLAKLCKRYFLFLKNDIIIHDYRRYAARAYRTSAKKGAEANGGKTEKARRRSRGGGDPAADFSVRHAAERDA